MYPGERKMVQYDFAPEDIEHVIDFLEWCGEVDLNGFPAKPPLGRVAAPVVSTGRSDVPKPELFKTICTACHSVGGEGGKVGPPLDVIGNKFTRDDLKAWISDPQKIKPDTTMPKIDMTAEQLDEIANYLLSLSEDR